MSRIADILITDMRHLIRGLGTEGGLITPSIYDTAQVIRMAPPTEGIWPAIEWLLLHQQADGGWGNPAVPMARDLPTLAAVLALYPHTIRKTTRDAVHAGLAFLRRQMTHWTGPLPDDIPVGVELLLPHLLDEAMLAGIDLPHTPYADLIALGNRRRQLISRLRLRAGTTPTHSWEALNLAPDPNLLDGSGGLGHSPAATAAWLRAADNRPDLADAALRARSYLDQAAAATRTKIPGVYPTVWPINRFEQVFGLYALLFAGLLSHPSLKAAVKAQTDDLARSVRPEGMGMSDYFLCDCDMTGTAMAVLAGAGYPTDPDIINRFAQGDHYYTYPGELQPSLSTTAHAVHGLALMGQTPSRAITYLLQHQAPDGRWMGDKWHSSWLYSTCHIGLALAAMGTVEPLRPTIGAICAYQHPDGGWGVTRSTAEETAHATMLLRTLMAHRIMDQEPLAALVRGEQWLRNNYRPFADREADDWIGKEVYVPRRVSRMIELAALLASETDTSIEIYTTGEADDHVFR